MTTTSPSSRRLLAKVALRIADGTAAGAWAHFFDTIHDDNLAEQPEGEIVARRPDSCSLHQRITREILDFGTADIQKEAKMLKQADFTFGSFKNKLPSLVGEVL
ncbi:hypothetical protein B0T16DRAFT_384321 [Cercophora newfieldiana]|uniref:Uncharacterized protein n=1 Tax=Cercophora newfieldiana TaxID=92897 RepID=A0AA39YMS5_9PEZI|nr:hypothetical protein B0T16DRAFT_384321 [Cercophora newfieldiana]